MKKYVLSVKINSRKFYKETNLENEIETLKSACKLVNLSYKNRPMKFIITNGLYFLLKITINDGFEIKNNRVLRGLSDVLINKYNWRKYRNNSGFCIIVDIKEIEEDNDANIYEVDFKGSIIIKNKELNSEKIKDNKMGDIEISELYKVKLKFLSNKLNIDNNELSKRILEQGIDSLVAVMEL